MTRPLALTLLCANLIILTFSGHDYQLINTLGSGTMNTVQASKDGSVLAYATIVDVYIYSIGDTFTSIQAITGFNGNIYMIELNDDGSVLVIFDFTTTANLYRRDNTGQYVSAQSVGLTSGDEVIRGCLSNDANFLGLKDGDTAGISNFEVHKLNTNTNLYEKVQRLTGTDEGMHCQFSDDNTFFFIGAQDNRIYKWDGSMYQAHQTLNLGSG